MKITLITVSYNSAATIGDTLRSVAEQTHPDIEHIVIDGGSKDGTLDIVREQGQRVSLCVSEPDRGIYDGMNKGLRRASGEFVGFLNADDVLADPEAIARMASLLERSPQADALYADLVYVKADDLRAVVRHWHSGVFARASLRRGWMPPHPTFYLRRSRLADIGEFDIRLRIAADYDFMLRLSYVAEVGHWPYIIYEYGEHEASLTSTRPMEHLQAIGRMFEKHRRLGLASRRDLSDLAVQISGTSRRRGQCWNGVRFGIKAICVWPFNWRAYRSTLFAFVVGARRGWGSARVPGAGLAPDKSSS